MTPQTQIAQQGQLAPREIKPSLPPAQILAVGTILTIRMMGHTRSNGVEYFAPAIVLHQFEDVFGSIEAIVFDPTAGTHYQHSYPIRDLSTNVGSNELYELRSNIGEILFAPDEFKLLLRLFGNLESRVMRLESASYAKDAGKDVGLAANPAKISPPIVQRDAENVRVKPHESDKPIR